MTPEQARFVIDHMTDEQRERFFDLGIKAIAAVIRFDKQITKSGQEMADNVELWLQGWSKP